MSEGQRHEDPLARAAFNFCVNGCATFLAVLAALVCFFGSAYLYVRWEIQQAVNTAVGVGKKLDDINKGKK